MYFVLLLRLFLFYDIDYTCVRYTTAIHVNQGLLSSYCQWCMQFPTSSRFRREGRLPSLSGV